MAPTRPSIAFAIWAAGVSVVSGCAASSPGPNEHSLASSASLVPVARQEAVALRYKLAEGSTWQHRVIEEFDGVITVADRPVSTRRRLQVESTWRVGKVNFEGKARVVQTVDRVTIEESGPESESSFDSAAETAAHSAATRAAGALVGTEIRFTIGPLGSLESLDFSEAFRQASAGRTATVPRMLTPDGWRQSLAYFGDFPEQPLSRGDSWKTSVEREYPFGVVQVDTQTTYEGSVERQGRLLESLSVSKTLGSREATQGVIAVRFVEFRVDGSYLFDNELGVPIEYVQKETRSLVLEVAGQPSEQRIHGTIRATLAPSTSEPPPEGTEEPSDG